MTEEWHSWYDIITKHIAKSPTHCSTPHRVFFPSSLPRNLFQQIIMMKKKLIDATIFVRLGWFWFGFQSPQCPFLLYRSSTEFHPQMGAIVIYILLGCICFYVVAIYSNWDIRQIKFTRISLDSYRLYIRLIMTLFKIENLHFVIQINIYGYFSCTWKVSFNIIAFGKQYAKQFYKQYECHQRSML